MIYRRTCPPGVWTKVIFDFGRGFEQKRHISLLAPEGVAVSGQYREIHYDWVIPCKPILGPLAPSMTFHRRWIDGIYSVEVYPDLEVVSCPA